MGADEGFSLSASHGSVKKMCGPVDEAAGLGLSMVGVVTTIGAGVGVGSGVYMLSNREV